MSLKNVIFISLTLILSHTATAAFRCDSITTLGLERCAKDNFESSDRKLNFAYRTLGPRLSPQQREMLLASQREWVIYKEKSCQSAYDATAPGEEAGIEKWTCLDKLTKTRLRELQYIDTGSGMSDFFHAVDIVARFYEGGDRSRFIDKLADETLESKDAHWSYYITENCKLTASRFHEEKRDCIARQGFYRY